MNRAHLKELIDLERPKRITSEMYAEPLLRDMERVKERAASGYKKSLLALYANPGLTDAQRSDGVERAHQTKDRVLEELVPLEKRYQEEIYIPLMIDAGVLKSSAARPAKRRSK